MLERPWRWLALLSLFGLGCQYELPPLGSTNAYYVDAVAGDDTGPGSLARPWRTIARVNAGSFAAGDRVLLTRGQSWAETLIPPSSGEYRAPITFEAHGEGAPPSSPA